MLNYGGTYRLEFLHMVSNETKYTKRILPQNLLMISIDGGAYNQITNKVTFRATVLPFPVEWLPRGPKLDGPYLDETHMRAVSIAYNLIICPDSQKATDIVLKKFKRSFKETYKKYFTEDFISILPTFLHHTFIGDVTNGYIKGIHFMSSDVRILKHMNSGLSNKISYGVIEKIDPLINSTLPKKAASSFWPNHWSIEKCITECSIAWSNRVQQNKNNSYIGKTTDGIAIMFCFRVNVFKTAYPVRSC